LLILECMRNNVYGCADLAILLLRRSAMPTGHASRPASDSISASKLVGTVILSAGLTGPLLGEWT
jgi:hypothetical protein